MNTLIEAITRIEQGRAEPGDLELLLHHTRQTSETNLQDSQAADKLFRLVQSITQIAAEIEPDQIALITAARVLDTLRVDSCVFLFWDEKRDCLVRYAQSSALQWNEPFLWPDTLRLAETEFLREPLKNRVPARWNNRDPRCTSFFDASDVESVLAVPVIGPTTLIGLLVILQRQSQQALPDTGQMYLQMLANAAAISMEHALLYQAEREHAYELEAVYRASLMLTASLDLSQVLDAILQAIFNLIRDAKDAHIFLYNGQALDFGAALWWNGRRDMLVMPRENGITHTAARRGETIVVTDMGKHELYCNAPASWTGSIISMPLKIGARVVGVMNVARVEKVGFATEEMRLLRLLADQAAMAIENARLHDLVQRQALTDSLTGLPNRRSFDQQLGEEIQRSARYHHPFSLLMMDLDNFKAINDTCGHPAGDAILKQVSAAFRRNLHDTDFLARYGGDEFAFILPETGAREAEAVVRRLKNLLAGTPFLVPGQHDRNLAGSFGYALFPLDASSSDELIEVADRRLYQAKNRLAHPD